MIFAHLNQADGKPLFIFGLSEENLQRLRQGQPITFDMQERAGAEHAPPGRVLICWGKTEDAIAQEWQELFFRKGGSLTGTHVVDHRRKGEEI